MHLGTHACRSGQCAQPKESYTKPRPAYQVMSSYKHTSSLSHAQMRQPLIAVSVCSLAQQLRQWQPPQQEQHGSNHGVLQAEVAPCMHGCATHMMPQRRCSMDMMHAAALLRSKKAGTSECSRLLAQTRCRPHDALMQNSQLVMSNPPLVQPVRKLRQQVQSVIADARVDVRRKPKQHSQRAGGRQQPHQRKSQ